jgi:hypothetical protein
VTAIDTFVSDTGKTEQPVDLTQYDLAVLVYDSALGTFSNHPPTITGPGKFEVDTLPPGDRYVRYSRLGSAPAYFVTSSSTLELGAARFGRPNLTRPSAGTTLVLNVTKAEAWQSGDVLQFFSLGAGTIGLDVVGAATAGAPAANDTTLTGLTIDYSALTLENLVMGDAGDRAHLTQLATRSLLGGGTYLAASRLFSMPAFTLTDGATTTVSGEFTTMPTTTVSVDYKASQFESAATSCNPSATILGRVVGASSQPAAELGSFSGSLDMLLYQAPDASDLVTTFTVGDPFSPAWKLFLGAGTVFSRDYALPSSTPASARGRVELRTLPSASTRLAPLVGCVQNPTVGGQDALADRTGAGRSPSIAFGAPSVGTADGYEIVLHGLVDRSGETVRVQAGRIVTAGRQVVVPPGILIAGTSYSLTIRAFARPAIDMNVRPEAQAFPGGMAETLGGVITP